MQTIQVHFLTSAYLFIFREKKCTHMCKSLKWKSCLLKQKKKKGERSYFFRFSLLFQASGTLLLRLNSTKSNFLANISHCPPYSVVISMAFHRISNWRFCLSTLSHLGCGISWKMLIIHDVVVRWIYVNSL